MKIFKVTLLTMLFTMWGYGLEVESKNEISQTDKILRVLYISYFDRAPDVGGLAYWSKAHDDYLADGLSSKDAFVKIANDFFKNSQAGELNAQSNEEFIKSVYLNQLGEVGDREGIKFWKDLLDGGLSRSEFMVDFVTQALNVKLEDITAENFPSFSALELETAQKRVTFLDDKLRLSVAFTNTFGELTNPKDVKDIANDPSYIASQLLMSEFKEKHDADALEIMMENVKDDFSHTQNPDGTEVMSALVAPLELEKNFKKYKKLWSSKNIQNYSYIYDKSCFCLPTEKIEVFVDDNELVDATYLPSNKKLTTEEFNYLGTVDDYFTIIENAIKDKVARLEVSYNKQYGYPTSIYIDFDEMIADEEIGHSLTHLKISGEPSMFKVDIPFREIGYEQFPSKVITSKEEMDGFIKEIKNTTSWHDKELFLSKLNGIEIDFSSENILFYRMTEGSGSTRLSVGEAIFSSSMDEVSIDIKRDVPEVGTDDMAYYALAYIVDKSIKRVTFDDKKQKVVIENKSSDMVVPQNCNAWFDGCNSCAKDTDGLEVCTERYCLVYRPQDFRCTEWKQ